MSTKPQREAKKQSATDPLIPLGGGLGAARGAGRGHQARPPGEATEARPQRQGHRGEATRRGHQARPQGEATKRGRATKPLKRQFQKLGKNLYVALKKQAYLGNYILWTLDVLKHSFIFFSLAFRYAKEVWLENRHFEHLSKNEVRF